MRHMTMKILKKLGFGIGLAAILLFVDQYTKQLASMHLKNAPDIPLISGIFELSYLENRGAAFGILQGQTAFLSLITVAALAVMLYIYLRIPDDRHYAGLHLIIILIISGAIGNFIDRCTHHYVVDFFYFKWIDFPIFNMADIYVTVSTGVLMLLFCFYYKEEEVDLLYQQILFWKKKEKN